MARVLLLDIGGVVLRSGHERMAELGRERPELATLTDRRGRLGPVPDDRWEMALAGTLSERTYWAERAGEIVGDDPAALMALLYPDDVPPATLLRPEAVALERAARGAGLVVGSLTNDLQAFQGGSAIAGHPLIAGLDPLVDGSITGALKPDPRAYAHALDALGHPDPADVVFLDDMPGNVEGALAAGFTAIRVDLTDPGAAFDRARLELGLTERAA